jgi:hypothetical protein
MHGIDIKRVDSALCLGVTCGRRHLYGRRGGLGVPPTVASSRKRDDTEQPGGLPSAR